MWSEGEIDTTTKPPGYSYAVKLDNRSKQPLHGCVLYAVPKSLEEVQKSQFCAAALWDANERGDARLYEKDPKDGSPGPRKLRQLIAVDRERQSMASLSGFNDISFSFYVEPEGSSFMRVELPLPPSCYVFYVSFIDAKGHYLQVNLSTRRLKSFEPGLIARKWRRARAALKLDGYRMTSD